VFHRAVGIILQCSHERGFSHNAALSGSGAYATFVAFGGKADMAYCTAYVRL
jgi:hypothetical protein